MLRVTASHGTLGKSGETAGGGIYTRKGPTPPHRPLSFHETIRSRRYHHGSLRGWIARIGSIRPQAPFVSVTALPLLVSAAPRREGVEAPFIFLGPAVDIRQSFLSCRARKASQGFRIEFRTTCRAARVRYQRRRSISAARFLVNARRQHGRNNIDPLKHHAREKSWGKDERRESKR